MPRRSTFLLMLVLLALAAALAIQPALARQPAAPYRILVTNDDGVRAPGLLALAEALKPLGEVTIVAPTENQSGKGHSITITDPIYAERVELPEGWSAHALVATPASCVKVALAALMPQKPDLVVSGINNGYNVGTDAYVSGTVGAAREAALAGIPAIAASLSGAGHPNYGPGAAMVARVAALVKARGLEDRAFLNVNIPPGAAEALKGPMTTTQSLVLGTESYEERVSPRGRRYFWNVYRTPADDVAGSEVWATARGYVSVTPLRATEFDRKTFDAWKDLK